ncbi:MAG: DUF4388 domain-containing protein [bacterium]|nr:DUF4388 domain-containing protein [bacterium]
MSLQGSLTDFPVADVFQLIGHQRKTGVLEVAQGDRRLQVLFLEGAVLSARPAEARPGGALAGFLLRTGVLSEAELATARSHQEETLESLAQALLSKNLVRESDLEQVQRLTTDESIFELFLWDEGSFSFRPEEVASSPGDSPIGAEMVLLDALRMRDEWANVRSQLSDLSVRISQAVDIDEFRLKRASVEQSSGMTAGQLEKLFNLANVPNTARRLIDLSRLGTFTGARALVALLRQQVIRIDSTSAKARAGRVEHSVSERPLLTVAVLGLAAILAGILWTVPELLERTHPIPADSLRNARIAATTLRLEAELESYRWAEGAYPQSLTALRGRGRQSLATVQLDHYSYARSETGFRLRRILP